MSEPQTEVNELYVIEVLRGDSWVLAGYRTSFGEAQSAKDRLQDAPSCRIRLFVVADGPLHFEGLTNQLREAQETLTSVQGQRTLEREKVLAVAKDLMECNPPPGTIRALAARALMTIYSAAEESEPSPRPSMPAGEPELESMRICSESIRYLDSFQRQRVLTWLDSWAKPPF